MNIKYLIYNYNMKYICVIYIYIIIKKIMNNKQIGKHAGRGPHAQVL